MVRTYKGNPFQIIDQWIRGDHAEAMKELQYPELSTYPFLEAAARSAAQHAGIPPALSEPAIAMVKQYGKGKRKRRSRSTGLGPVIKKDGTSTGTGRFQKKKKKRSSKKRKKSVKKMIKEVKKLIPKKSYKSKNTWKTILLSCDGGPNRRRIFKLDMMTPTMIEGFINSLAAVDSATTVDYTARNSSIKVNCFYNLEVKNNATSNAHIKYNMFKCIDDDQEDYLDNIIEGVADRGITIPAVDNEIPAAATNSYVPRRIEFNAGEPYHYPIFGVAHNRGKWKALGKLNKAVVGPGDTFNIVKAFSVNYKPEDLDTDAFTYKKNTSYQLIIDISGDLAHDQTNTSLVGRQEWQLVAEEQIKMSVSYSNPLGLREEVYSDTLTNTNFTQPVHADNFSSSVEIADV